MINEALDEAFAEIEILFSGMTRMEYLYDQEIKMDILFDKYISKIKMELLDELDQYVINKLETTPE